MRRESAQKGEGQDARAASCSLPAGLPQPVPRPLLSSRSHWELCGQLTLSTAPTLTVGPPQLVQPSQSCPILSHPLLNWL